MHIVGGGWWLVVMVLMLLLLPLLLSFLGSRERRLWVPPMKTAKKNVLPCMTLKGIRSPTCSLCPLLLTCRNKETVVIPSQRRLRFGPLYSFLLPAGLITRPCAKLEEQVLAAA